MLFDMCPHSCWGVVCRITSWSMAEENQFWMILLCMFLERSNCTYWHVTSGTLAVLHWRCTLHSLLRWSCSRVWKFLLDLLHWMSLRLHWMSLRLYWMSLHLHWMSINAMHSDSVTLSNTLLNFLKAVLIQSGFDEILSEGHLPLTLHLRTLLHQSYVSFRLSPLEVLHDTWTQGLRCWVVNFFSGSWSTVLCPGVRRRSCHPVIIQ